MQTFHFPASLGASLESSGPSDHYDLDHRFALSIGSLESLELCPSIPATLQTTAISGEDVAVTAQGSPWTAEFGWDLELA